MEEQTLQEMIHNFIAIAFDVAGDKVVRDRVRPEKYVITAGETVQLELFEEAGSHPFFEMQASVGEAGLTLTREIYTEEDGWHRPDEQAVLNALLQKTQREAAEFFVKLIDECLKF